jgi:hypothetical protein
MASFGDDFRHEAVLRAGSPVFKDVGGWRFGLSFGIPADLDEPTYEVLAERSFKRVIPDFDVKYADAKHTFILSASLQPIGRGSTEKDWHYLGQMVAAVRAPLEACKTPPDKTHPNAVHYWVWQEEVVFGSERREDANDRRDEAGSDAGSD